MNAQKASAGLPSDIVAADDDRRTSPGVTSARRADPPKFWSAEACLRFSPACLPAFLSLALPVCIASLLSVLFVPYVPFHPAKHSHLSCS